ncbi:unnamed protein product [Mytilus coruscus]|uniref:Farnesoic acid O-methyl transferase domain-containing protein n=1 Tax=Mytilus coruscus TaxID=42192 RepID=A0A6J8AH14_MYTCO|nr:unnamed protein product [Mytilus coruscus]
MKLHRKNNNNPALTQITPDAMNCTEFRAFQISWTMIGNIVLAKDTNNGSEIIFDWKDPSPLVINGVDISTGLGSDGLWIIEHAALFTGYYCFVPEAYGDMLLMSMSTGRSEISCLSECSLDDYCLAVNFNIKMHKFQLIAVTQPIKKSIQNNWAFYTKCVQGKFMCLACIG